MSGGFVTGGGEVVGDTIGGALVGGTDAGVTVATVVEVVSDEDEGDW